jgi:hypothetical protein
VTCSQLLEGFKCESKLKITEEQKVGACSLAYSILEGSRGVLEIRDGTRKNWQAWITHTNVHKTNTRWLVHSWSTFGVKMSHGQLGFTRLTMARTWGKPPPSPLIVYFVPFHGGHIQMAFCPKTPKWEFGNSHNWDFRDFGGA